MIVCLILTGCFIGWDYLFFISLVGIMFFISLVGIICFLFHWLGLYVSGCTHSGSVYVLRFMWVNSFVLTTFRVTNEW